MRARAKGGCDLVERDKRKFIFSFSYPYPLYLRSINTHSFIFKRKSDVMVSLDWIARFKNKKRRHAKGLLISSLRASGESWLLATPPNESLLAGFCLCVSFIGYKRRFHRLTKFYWNGTNYYQFKETKQCFVIVKIFIKRLVTEANVDFISLSLVITESVFWWSAIHVIM